MPEARTTTGELIDQGSNASATATPDPQATSAPQQTTAPEAYTDFKAADGITLDPKLIGEATPLFKELGLTQDNAQRLVDFYNKQLGDVSKLAAKAVEEMRTSWRDAVKADKEIGGKLDSVLVEIGRAKDRLPAEVRQNLNDALNLTGAGDHPAIVRAFYEFAKLVNEGSHVTGAAPSPHGQERSGQASRPTLAGAMYPNLAR